MPAFARRVVGRLATTYAGRLLQAYLSSQAGNYASGLAFNAFISMFPLILGLLAIIGLVTRDPAVRRQFLNGALSYFPSDSHSALTHAFDGVRSNSGLIGAVSIIGLLWSGSALFTSMEFALGRMFGARQRDFLQQRAMTLVMTVTFGLSVILAVGLNSASSLAGSVPHIEPVVGLVVWVLFMSAVYRIVPNRTYSLRHMWPGILLAAVLTEALSLLWPLFTGLSHGFSTYGAALALFFLLASWLYFLSQFILVGAVAIRMHAGAPNRRGLFSTAKGPPLQTEATEAADHFSRRAA